MATPQITVIKRPNQGKGYGNVYLLSTTPGYQQTIQPDSTIKFNGFTKLATMSWLTSDTITMLKTGTYQITFQVNYVTLSDDQNVQVGLYANGEQICIFGESVPLRNNVSKLSGTYVIKANANDKIQFVGIDVPFTIKGVSQNTEIIANVTITEI